jgi:hypothetical protein
VSSATSHNLSVNANRRSKSPGLREQLQVCLVILERAAGDLRQLDAVRDLVDPMLSDSATNV